MDALKATHICCQLGPLAALCLWAPAGSPEAPDFSQVGTGPPSVGPESGSCVIAVFSTASLTTVNKSGCVQTAQWYTPTCGGEKKQ